MVLGKMTNPIVTMPKPAAVSDTSDAYPTVERSARQQKMEDLSGEVIIDTDEGDALQYSSQT